MTSGLQELQSALNRSSISSEPGVRLVLMKTFAESSEYLRSNSVRSGEYFMSMARELSRIKGLGNADLRIDCQLSCAEHFYSASQPSDALRSARAAVQLADASHFPARTRRAYGILGVLLADNGDVAHGIECLTNAFSIARDLEDDFAIANALNGLGVALNYGAQFREALRCFQYAFKVTESKSPELLQLRPTILINTAQAHQYRGEVLKGLAAAERSIIESKPPVSTSDFTSRVVREYTYISLLIENGQVRAAKERLETARHFLPQIVARRPRYLFRLSEGIVAVHLGDTVEGLTILESVFRESEEDSTAKGDALVLLIKANELLGRNSEALRYLGLLMARVRARRSGFALDQLGVVGAKIDFFQCENDDLHHLELHEATLKSKTAADLLFVSEVEFLERLSITADLREETSGEHGFRVGQLARLLCEEIGINSLTCDEIGFAARLHDIGKIGVPDRILLTSQELKDAQRHFMRAHTLIGSELLTRSNIPQLRMAEEIARCHHEWWNGAGYPAKLSGKRIPIHARIVALADVFDAMTHGRPYSESWGVDKALAEIQKLRGEQFDPDLTDRFIELITRLWAEYPDLDEYLGRFGRRSPFMKARHRIREMLASERDREVGLEDHQTNL